MTLDAISPLPSVGDLAATFGVPAPPAIDQGPQPADPFAILLAAAEGQGSVAPSLPSAPSQTASVLPTTPAAPTDPGSSSVVADAERYLGVPYQWGGTSPTTGFDCSGLVQHVFADLGVTLPRTSEQQVQAGTAVDGLANAVPGDLLFFEPGPDGAPGHVAIYAGDGKMIAAPHTGENVQIQAVPSTPLAIRRVAVSGAPTSVPQGSVQLGHVVVPGSDAALVEQSAAAAGVPPSLLAAVLYTESRFDPNAVSSAGAEGIAQFMPTTAASAGINPFDPTQAVPAAANLLAGDHTKFGTWPLAVAAYGAGAGAVERAGGIPNDGTTPGDVQTVLGLADLGDST